MPGDHPAGVQWAFTQAAGKPDVLLASGLDAAQHEVDATIYAINRPDDVAALIRAQQRCQCVRVISDATQSGGAEQAAALKQLQAANIPVKVDAHSGIMHMKVAEIDRQTVFEGSFNWTTPASTVNDEILVRVDSADFANAFAQEFETMWNDSRRFKDWTPAARPLPLSEPARF